MSLPTERTWIRVSEIPPVHNEVVMTKIDDENGVRNIQPLKKQGNLWWTPDGAMYVYYTPTHWQSITTMTPERTKEEILEKHCPSMNNLFLDKQGRAFRDRILAAMEEYKSQCSPVESKWGECEDEISET